MSESMKKVTLKEVAASLNMPIGTVGSYLSNHPTAKPTPGSKAELVQNTAKAMGYKSRAELKAEREAMPKPPKYYYGTAFNSQAAGIQYAKHLRENGYGNTEIAKKAGVNITTIRRWIGPAPAELTRCNRVMGQKLRAQKNRLCKVAAQNVKVAAFNKQVKEHAELKARLSALEAELRDAAPTMQALPKPATVPAIQMDALTPIM